MIIITTIPANWIRKKYFDMNSQDTFKEWWYDYSFYNKPKVIDKEDYHITSKFYSLEPKSK